MSYALVYLLHRLVAVPFQFFHHWYVDGTRAFGSSFMGTLRRLDQTFAVYITFKYFWQPLYKDYSFVGRILGVFFRTVRIILGSVAVAATTLVFLAAYLLWLVVPPAILYYAARNV